MSHFHTLTVAQVRHETRDTIVATFAVPPALRERFAYTQGQYLTLRARVNGEELRRAYSICSAVQDDELRVAIKRVPGGQFSTWANDTLKAGTAIEAMPPMGHFNLPLSADAEKRYLMVAAGSGITPILSIIKTTLLAEPQSHITLLYGNRATAAVIFREELAELKDRFAQRFNIVYVMSREQQDVELFHGRITREKCDALFQQWVNVADHDAAFLCGPQDMIAAVTEALQAHGMPKSAIKAELFAAATPAQPRATQAREVQGQAECEVTIVMDGSHRSFSMAKDKESVLDAGLRHGIDLRYSCKGGVCATCRCKVLSGRVEMDANQALEDYEIARGFVLSCQAFPVTDELVLDFDQDH
jgi:ring-1,2-phenylacetyl-CoA epoxidase subunit PaaE